MSVKENLVMNNGAAAMDLNTESLPSQNSQSVSDTTEVKNHSTVILNGKATTAELSAVPAPESQEIHPSSNTESLVQPATSPELGGATEGLSPEEPKAVPLSVASLATTLAPADQLWSTSREKGVQLRLEGSGPGSETPITIHQMFLETIERSGDTPALMFKKDGQSVSLTWREYYEQCRAAAKSFLKLGLERYHGVGILGFNSPEWFISDIGCIMAGGLAAGIYTTNSAEACQYVAANCEANVLVVENQKQLDKILQVKDHLPHLKAIVQYKGELLQKAPFLYTWAEFMKLGEDIPNEQLNAVIDSLRANECCTLIYTSGTTGNPKGVMLSHDNITWTARTASAMVHTNSCEEEVVVSYLPLSHVAAQMVDIWISMAFVGTTYFAEPDALKGSLVNTLQEARPTCFLGVPRVWEKIQEKMKATGAKASPLRKRVADWAKSIGLQYNYSAMNGENRVPWGFTLANNLVFKKVRATLGLDRCKLCLTGAAPITKETLEYFMSLNIPVMELYGMSESSGPHTVSIDEYRIASCGKVMPGCKIRLENPDQDGNGEICFWGRNVFMGYLNMADKTTEALDEDGWLHSGDLGRNDQNDFLYITGRIKELIITAGGENIPPVPIEDAVKAELPIISNAMLIGDKLKFLSMLLTLKCVTDDNGEPTDELSSETLEFCQQNGITATKVSEIIANKEPAVYKAIQEGMERVNARSVSNAQKVQKWVILERDFSITGGELGPTMKLRRPIVVKMYQEKINEIYAVAAEK